MCFKTNICGGIYNNPTKSNKDTENNRIVKGFVNRLANGTSLECNTVTVDNAIPQLNIK
jgi:hypothetical protein